MFFFSSIVAISRDEVLCCDPAPEIRGQLRGESSSTDISTTSEQRNRRFSARASILTTERLNSEVAQRECRVVLDRNVVSDYLERQGASSDSQGASRDHVPMEIDPVEEIENLQESVLDSSSDSDLDETDILRGFRPSDAVFKNYDSKRGDEVVLCGPPPKFRSLIPPNTRLNRLKTIRRQTLETQLSRPTKVVLTRFIMRIGI